MNYKRIYNELILNAKNRDYLDGIFERHHILPRSMGGSDDASNIVILSLREHYIAHWLLYKIHRSKSMAHAWNAMACHRGLGNSRNRYTSHTFKYAKEAFIKSRSVKSPDEDLSNPFREDRKHYKRGGSKPVKATCSDTGECIIFDSASWAAKCVKGDQSTISRCCAKQSSMHKGYYWSYDDDIVKSSYTTNSRIRRTDADGNEVIFRNLTAAVEGTPGSSKPKISNCANGKRSKHLSYTWEYISE